MGDFEKKKSNKIQAIQPIQPIPRIKNNNREKTVKDEKDKENKKNDYLAVLEEQKQKQQQQRQEEERKQGHRQTNTSIEHLQRDFRKRVGINKTEENLKNAKAQEAYKKQEKYEER